MEKEADAGQQCLISIPNSGNKDWLLAIGSGIGMLGFGAWGLKDNANEIMISFISQAPGILGVLLISRLFLSHMNRRELQYNVSMTKLAEDCHVVHSRAITSLEKNTIMMGRAIQTLDHQDRELSTSRKDKRKEVERETA